MKINLYGVSYGTLLALHYLKMYPQSLRSVILDGVLPPQINFLRR
jgi:pimeloyl-ACP methyl ester carboxylesterase